MITPIIQDVFANKYEEPEPEFSVDPTLSHFRKHQNKYLIGGGAAAGAGLGYALSKKSAKRSADKRGLVKGTKEYKSHIKKHRLKRTLIGGISGTVVGAGLAVGKHLYDVNHHSSKKMTPKPGDLVKFTRANKRQIGQHYAMYIGNGKVIDHSGNGPRIHNLKDHLNFYGKDGTKVKIEPAKKSLSRSEIAKRLRKIRKNYHADNYDAFDNNCEHFARELSSGKRHSTQSDTLLGRVGKIFLKNKV